MALEVLYGPSAITAGVIAATSVGGFTWIQGLGLLAVLDVGGFSLYAVQMDGSAQGPRSSYFGTGFGPVLDLRSSRGLAVRNVGNLYSFNYLTGSADTTVSLLSGSAVFRVNVIAADRYLGFFDSGGGLQAQATHDGTTYTAEYTFTGGPGSIINVSRGRSTTEVCLAFNTGQIRFYDTVGKKQNGATLFIGEGLSSSEGCWYVPKHDVFVELKSLQLKILANAVAPATLSNPAASPAVVAGNVSQLTVQLRGAQSEPCVGELIDWSIPSGAGSLVLAQSATDLNGNATNSLIVPVGSSGSVVVDAQLSF
jgi:hypothetical protein